MLDKLKERMRDADYRRLFATIFASKVLGVVALIIVIKCLSAYFFTPAFADDAPAAAAEPTPALSRGSEPITLSVAGAMVRPMPTAIRHMFRITRS